MTKKQIEIKTPFAPKYMKRDKAAVFEESMRQSAVNDLFHTHKQDGHYEVFYDILTAHVVTVYSLGPRDILFRRYR